MTNLKNILRYSVITGIFLIPFIPFIVPTSMFFPFITGKGFVFRIIVEIIFGLSVVLAFVDTTYRPKLSLISKSVLIFSLTILIADLFGQNVYKSIWSNYERMEGFVLIAHLVLYYFVLTSVFNYKTIWDKYINTNIGASVLMTLFGYMQLAGVFKINQGGARIDGTFGNAAYLAIYLIFNIFLSIYMLTDKTVSSWKKWAYSSVVIMELIALYFTATRGAILGIIGGGIVTAILLMWSERENKTVRKFSVVTLVSILGLVMVFMMIKNTSFVRNSQVLSRFSTLSFSEFKTQGRYFVWPMALQGIKEKPILGWGQENFNFVFNKNYNPQMFGQEEWFDRTHNVVLDWLIAGGLLGFIAYVLIYLAMLHLLWKKESGFSNTEKSILTGLVIAYIFHNMFVFDNLVSYILFFTVLAFIHSVSTRNEVKSGEFYTKTYSNDSVNYIITPSVLVVTIILIYFINIPAVLANKNLIKAMTPQGSIEKNLESFKKAYSYNSFGGSEITEQLVTISSQLSSPQANATLQQKQLYFDYAKQKIDEKLEKTPNDARYLVFAGILMNRYAMYDEATKYLERARVESPKKQTILFELATSYLGRGEYAKGLAIFKEAYELKPEARESQVLYAIGSIYAKDFTTFNDMLVKLGQETIISDIRFLNTYINLGDYTSAINILNVRISNNSKDNDAKLTLAYIYSRIGQKDKAISIVRTMINEDPSFKQSGEEIIKQIQSS